MDVAVVLVLVRVVEYNMNGNIITDDEYNNIGYDWLIRLLVE